MTENAKNLVNKVNDLFPEIGSDMPKSFENTLNLLIVGNPQENLFSVINELLGDFDPLDCSMMSGYRGTITYSESNAVIQMDSGEPVASNMIELAETLKAYNQESVQHRFVITCSNPLLEGCVINVLASDKDYEDINWNAELSAADYIFFTMSSTALLSMCERKTLRKWLLPYASDALAVILTHNNLILTADRNDIEESLRVFFHNSVPVYRLPEEDLTALRKLIESLKENVAKLHGARTARIEKLILNSAKDAIDLQIGAYSESNEELQKVIETIRNSSDKLPARAKAASRQIRLDHIEPMKIEISRAVSEFYDKINAYVKNEIMGTEITEDLSDVLANYLADAWKNESDILMDRIQSGTASMQSDMQLYIEKDFRNYIEKAIGATQADYVYALSEQYFHPEDLSFDKNEGPLQYDSAKNHSKSYYYGTIAAGIAIVLSGSLLIGSAIAVFGPNKVKKKAEASYTQQNRDNLISACEEANKAYKDDLMMWQDSVIDSINQNVNTIVDDCYQKMSDAVVKALSARMDDQNTYKQRLDELSALKNEIEQYLS